MLHRPSDKRELSLIIDSVKHPATPKAPRRAFLSASPRFVGRGFKTNFISFLIVVALLLTPVASQAGTATTLHSAIPPQALRTALAAWAAQTHLQVVHLSSVVREQQSPGASSGLAADAALAQLLRGTGLQFEFLSPELVRVRVPPTAAPALTADSPPIEQEVVVTAAASREGPQAPLSRIMWSRDELDASQITNVVRLADLTPGVTF